MLNEIGVHRGSIPESLLQTFHPIEGDFYRISKLFINKDHKKLLRYLSTQYWTKKARAPKRYRIGKPAEYIIITKTRVRN